MVSLAIGSERCQVDMKQESDFIDDPNRASTSFAKLPADLQIKILSFLTPSSILKARGICSSIYNSSRQLSLWASLARIYLESGPLPAIPISQRDFNSEAKDRNQNQVEEPPEVESLVRSLERVLVSRERLDHSWRTPAAEPSKSYTIRAHKDRVTCIKLLEAESVWSKDGSLKQRRWLITGSVDGFIKVFDLSELEDQVEQEGNESRLSKEETASPSKSSNFPFGIDKDNIYVPNLGISAKGLASIPALGSPRRASATSRNSSKPSRRGRHSCLIAEVDTGGDVTSIDAELSEDCRSIKVATGSYYSSSAASVYLLGLEDQPTLLDLKCSLDPPEWCGTQTVSIRGDMVAVGSYVGLIHLFNWRTGWRGGIDREERSSTASIKLIGDFVVSITRVGLVEVFSLPTPFSHEHSSGTTLESEGEDSDNRTQAEQEQSDPSALSSMALLSLTDTVSSSTRNSGKTQVAKRKAHLLERFSIGEGNKPLLGASFGDTERGKSRGSGVGKAWEKELDRRLAVISSNDAPVRQGKGSIENDRIPGTSQDIIEPLSIYVLDASGVSQLVLGPDLHPSTSSSSGSNPPSSSYFPYAWPPRIQSRQAIRGERGIGISTGASGCKAIVMTSLGGVPPVCSCRAISAPQKIGEVPSHSIMDFQGDSGSEASFQSGSGSGTSGYGNGTDRLTTSSLLIPIKPTKAVGIPSHRSLETRRFSSSELSHQSKRSSPFDSVISSGQSSATGAASSISHPSSSQQVVFSSLSSPSPPSSGQGTLSSSSGSGPSPQILNPMSIAASTSSGFDSVSSMQHSTTSFDACIPSSRADIFTEQAFNDTGLLCLATARGQIYIADYS